MFEEMLERLRIRARIFAIASLAVMVVTFALLFYLQRPIDDVATVSKWSPFEVEVWFRRANLRAATGILHGGDDDGYMNGEQLTMLSLNDLRSMYRTDGHQDTAVDVYQALQLSLRPLSPITTWFVITVVIQTGFIYGVMFFILLCVGVRYVKKKVDANPMVQQMKMLTGAMSPPSSANGMGMGANTPNPMMNPMLNPFGAMMAMQNATTAAAIAQSPSNNDDDPTSAVDAPVGPNAMIDPTAMMMANPFLFPFGPLPPGALGGAGGAGGAAGAMPPLFPFGPMGMSMAPPPGLVARAAARRRAAAAASAAATNWTPDLD